MIRRRIVRLLDQSVLPHQVCYLHLRHEAEVASAIRSLKVRGAPVIGVTAAFGMALALTRFWQERGPDLTPDEARAHLTIAADLLRAARPTAVNLPWAVARMLRCANAALRRHATCTRWSRDSNKRRRWWLMRMSRPVWPWDAMART